MFRLISFIAALGVAAVLASAAVAAINPNPRVGWGVKPAGLAIKKVDVQGAYIPNPRVGWRSLRPRFYQAPKTRIAKKPTVGDGGAVSPSRRHFGR